MTRNLESEKKQLFSRAREFGQEHVFRFWDDLSAEEKERLLDQVKSIDFEQLRKLTDMALSETGEESADMNLETTDIVSLKERQEKDEEAIRIGEEALRKGHVAAFMVAGGQGSRLGFDGPKGIYPVTPVRKKPLFQVFSEKLTALQRRYDCTIPWYIMTSKVNHEDTITFFEEQNYFTLDGRQFMFFNQDMVPAIDREGKLILDAPDHIFMNPNGHGGSLKALWDSGAIDDMKSRGIQYIFYFQVDNVLTKIADPAFIGYHIMAGSEMSNKVVHKAYPEEKMGVICEINGKVGLVEYSDLSEEYMYARDEDGELKFWAGSIATHMINIDFVERENKHGFRLPFHVAEKNIPHINEKGETIKPEGKNGIKFETFVFDALLDTNKSISVEIERKKEFSPLKNKSGMDSPETVFKDQISLFADWFRKAGFEIPVNEEGVPEMTIEVSPLFAPDVERFLERKKDIPAPFDGLYLEEGVK